MGRCHAARHARLRPKAEQLARSALLGAAASGLGLTGERAGKPLLRVVDPGKAPLRTMNRVRWCATTAC